MCAVLTIVGMVILGHRFAQQRDVPAAIGGIGLDPGGRTVLVQGPRRVSAAESAWLAEGTVPTAPTGVPADLARDALLDLHSLSGASGVTVAGWTRQAWRYAWPRDSAFVAAAFARTGHVVDAERQLDFLQSVQGGDGRFQARYDIGNGLPPDDRGIELDGSGWSIWALKQVVASAKPGDRGALIDRYRRLLDRSVHAIDASLDPRTGLPAVSLDYWEVKETKPTLATAAVLLAGLRAASDLYSDVGSRPSVKLVDHTADGLEKTIIDKFESDGYPRREGGAPRSVDLGVTFLLPPFAGLDKSTTTAVWVKSRRFMARPAGGLAPGWLLA